MILAQKPRTIVTSDDIDRKKHLFEYVSNINREISKNKKRQHYIRIKSTAQAIKNLICSGCLLVRQNLKCGENL